jgi:hypothetical protein
LWQEGNSFAGCPGLFGNTQRRASLQHDRPKSLLRQLARAVLLDLNGKNRQQKSHWKGCNTAFMVVDKPSSAQSPRLLLVLRGIG